MKLKAFVSDFVETIVLSAILLAAVYWKVAAVEMVWGSSMEPTFETGERILVDKVTPHFRSYERGDIVVLEPPGNESKHYIKRIIGLPGDIFKIFDCKVYVSRDGGKFELAEPYLGVDVCTAGGSKVKEGRSVKINEDNYMVMGDNRSNSIDSRVFGFVPRENVVGRVIFRLWPISKAGFTL